jgi:hypothetical protein
MASAAFWAASHAPYTLAARALSDMMREYAANTGSSMVARSAGSWRRVKGIGMYESSSSSSPSSSALSTSGGSCCSHDVTVSERRSRTSVLYTTTAARETVVAARAYLSRASHRRGFSWIRYA